MKGPPWTKRRFLTVYWIVQFAIAYGGWMLLFGGYDFSLLIAPEYALWMGGSLLLIMVAQALLLMPVSPPAPERGGARWWRHLRCGMAVGAMAGYACVVAMFGLNALGVRIEHADWLTLPIVPAAVVTPIATLLFAKFCPRGMPALLTAALAACMAASLALGVVFALSSIPTILGPKKSILSGGSDAYAAWWWSGSLAAFFLTWIVATPLLLAFIRRGDRDSALARVASRLFLGSAIEAGAVIPLDVMVRRKTDCYCGESTLWTLTICWGVGTLVLGPAIWLVPLARRRKRWFQGRCEVCGYDMSGCMTALKCPECGSGWRSKEPDAAAPGA